MVEVGGRKFDAVSKGTMEWDVMLLRLLQGCGLADVTLHQGETAQGLAHRVFRTLLGSGAVFEILGCVLVPAGTDPLKWTPEVMATTAAFLKQLSAPDDKQAINSQIVALVTHFFQTGLLSMSTSHRSLDPAGGPNVEQSASHRPAISTSGNGA
jgi:hypothetical protein